MGVYQKYKDSEGNPTGFWFVKYPYKRDILTGKIKYKTEKAGISKKLALRLYNKKYEEYKQREHLDWNDEQPMPFTQLIEWYLEFPEIKNRVYYRDIKRYCEKWKEYFGNLLVSEIKPSMVEKYRHERLQQMAYHGKYKGKQKVTPASVNREVSTLKRIFNLAIREDLATKNPCWKVSKLSENNERKRILSQEELTKLLSELPQHAKDIVEMGYFTGMRSGEIFNLTWDKVNLKEGYIELEAEDTKTEDPRRIYYVEKIGGILTRLNKVRYLDHNYVFAYKGTQLKSIKTSFNNACKKANLDNLHFHDLRHTFNTMMRKAGVSKSVIMKMTGHKTSSMFERYNTIDEDDAKDALNKLKQFLESQAEKKVESAECSHSAPKV